jgi:hypothetical protein
MQATRAWLGSAVEWLVAGALTLLALSALAVATREFQTVTAGTPVIAREFTQPEPPAAVPERAVSVPMLLLSGGTTIRIGATISQVAAALGRQAEIGTQWVEPMLGGERLTRFYEHHGATFVLVFEALTKEREPRVAGIYVH